LSNTLFRGKTKEDCNYKKHGLTPPKRTTDGTVLTSWLDKHSNPFDRDTPKKTRGLSTPTKDQGSSSRVDSINPEPTTFKATSSSSIDHDRGNREKDPLIRGSVGCTSFPGGPVNPIDLGCTWFFETTQFIPYIQNKQPQGVDNSQWIARKIRAVANQLVEDFTNQLYNQIVSERGLPVAVRSAGGGTFDLLTVQRLNSIDDVCSLFNFHYSLDGLPFLDATVVPTASDPVVTAHAALATKEFPPAHKIEQGIEDVVVRDSDVVGEDIEVQSAAEGESGSTPGS
jgi:hypothetical protein